MEKIKQGYKQTDIGVIPEDWEVKPIGKTLKIKHGKDQKKVLSIDGKYPILGTGGLMGYATNFLYSQESVLIGRKGTINKPMFMDKPFWTVDTLFYSEIKKGYLPKFIYYKFQMIDWYAYNEASGVPSLNAKTIEKIDISTPNNISEQTAIATALSDTDALIVALDKKIAKKQQIKQGAMQQLLTGKKRLPGFSGEWVEKKLGELLDYEQPTKYIVKNTDYIANGIPVLTAGKSFILGYTTETSGVFRSIPVIIFDDFTTATKFVDFRFKVKSSAMKILKLRDSKNNIKLIYELILLIDFPLTDHQRYWISEYSKIIVKIPNTKKEQDNLAQILTDMDHEIAQLEKERDKYKELKAGIMQVLLTGKIRLI